MATRTPPTTSGPPLPLPSAALQLPTVSGAAFFWDCCRKVFRFLLPRSARSNSCRALATVRRAAQAGRQAGWL